MSPASAGIVYTLTPATIGNGLTATGTITTDGNTGVLSAADITSVNMTISGGSAGTTTFSSTGANVTGTALTATATSLLFNFSNAVGASFSIGDSAVPFIYLYFQSAPN